MAYIELADIKAEGVKITGTQMKTRIASLIKLAEQWFHLVTQQWFKSRSFTEGSPLKLSGDGSPVLKLPIYAIEVEKIIVDGVELDKSEYVVYNRKPPSPDVKNPRIVRVVASGSLLSSSSEAIWPKGNLNISLVGKFGRVEFEDDKPVTPEMVKHTLKKLVIREIPGLADEAAQDLRRRGWLKSEATDGHSYTLSDIAVSGALTGDIEIDNAVLFYSKPLFCKAIGGSDSAADLITETVL